MRGIFDLFQACNVISSMNYEGAAGVGSLVVAEKGHTAVDVQIEFAEPVNPTNYRKIRKLLEMCNEDTVLLYGAREIYGLGKLKDGAYDPKQENLFIIKFVKHHSWELVHEKTALMQTTYNEPRLPLPKIDEGELRGKLGEKFPAMSPETTSYLVDLAKAASDAKHGAMLVISGEAAAEVKPDRLGKQSTPIKPHKLKPEQLLSVSSIDGAVFLDDRGVCYALGVILDGHATPKGDSARGARYNSAIRYVEEHPNCISIVVSEDGMVDIQVGTPKPAGG